jgi:hypothetical protein
LRGCRAERKKDVDVGRCETVSVIEDGMSLKEFVSPESTGNEGIQRLQGKVWEQVT